MQQPRSENDVGAFKKKDKHPRKEIVLRVEKPLNDDGIDDVNGVTGKGWIDYSQLGKEIPKPPDPRPWRRKMSSLPKKSAKTKSKAKRNDSISVLSDSRVDGSPRATQSDNADVRGTTEGIPIESFVGKDGSFDFDNLSDDLNVMDWPEGEQRNQVQLMLDDLFDVYRQLNLG